MKRLVLAAILAAAAGCARTTAAGDDSAGVPPAGSVDKTPTKETDWAAIEQLEVQAKAIAKTEGCSSVSECRAAPVGSRACGGPRYYISYCARTTDSAALFSKLAEVAKAEQAFNKKYQIASTCEFRMPPAPSLSGGACKGQ
jgi:hypothetical protein